MILPIISRLPLPESIGGRFLIGFLRFKEHFM